MDKDYTKRELDHMFTDVHSKLDALIASGEKTLAQTIRTNGRTSKLERNLMIIGCVVGTILLMKFPEVFEIITKFI